MRARVLLTQTSRAAGRRAIWTIGLPVTILLGAFLLGAFAYQAQHTWMGHFDHSQTRAPIGGSTGYGTEDFANFNRWRRNVEQALKDAEARDQVRPQDPVKAKESVDATITANKPAQEAGVDLSIGREAARTEETSSETTENEAGAGAEAANPARTRRDTNGANGAQSTSSTESPERSLANVPASPAKGAQPAASPGAHEGIAWPHMRRHGWGRRYGMGSRVGWGYHRLIGVARAFPYVLSVR